MTTTGERIRQLREQKGMTQGDLMRAARAYIPADKVLSRATISRVEGGLHQPNSWTLDAIASALGVRTDTLLARTQQDSTPLPAPDIVPLVEQLNRTDKRTRAYVAQVACLMLAFAAGERSEPTEEDMVAELLPLLRTGAGVQRAQQLLAEYEQRTVGAAEGRVGMRADR